MINKEKFMITCADIGALNAGVTTSLNLESTKTEYGNNFNTILISNQSSVELIIKLNGRNAFYLQSGDTFGLDWEDGLLFDDVQITNNDGAVNTSANEIRCSVGRTGAN